MENELNVPDVPTSQFYTCTESLYYTSIQEPTPNDAPSTPRVFPTSLKEYQSKDIREVKGQGQTMKYVKKGKGNKLGGGQASGVYEVVVDTGIEHVGRNAKYHTYVAKKFRGFASDSLYGQWQEQVHGLSEYYGGYICEFYGYCRNYDYYEGSDEDSEDDYKTACEQSCDDAFDSDSDSKECSFDEGYDSASETAFETAFCILMRKYDCSLRNVLDEQMRKNHNIGRPLHPSVAVLMMLQTAMGMRILHQENIIHRDLKADNVFVYLNATDNMPWGAYISDFDNGLSTFGSAYWRAPEILEAHAEQIAERELKFKMDEDWTPRPLPWTPMTDVYSYAMTCYEILTGDIPFKGKSRNQYQDVSRGGLRPVLPMDLNPAIKNLISRCWHQNPLQRPTFDAILMEWKELLHGRPYEFWKSFDASKKLLPLRNRPSTKECISRLERELEGLRSKYPVQFFVQQNEVDFVKMGFHFVKCIKKAVRKFGYKPFIEHPSPPWSLWFGRLKWNEKLWRLSIEFGRAFPFIDEIEAISKLKLYILTSISEGSQEAGISFIQEEGTSVSQMEAKMRSYNENVKKRPPLGNRHFGCIEKYKHGHYEGDKDYPICSFCKVKKKVENASKPKFRLFDDKFASEPS